MGKKKIRAVLKLELQAGKATPAPPVGTALGPHGINIMEFTKAYNERTAQQAGDVVPAEITIFEDRTFTFVLKTPPAVNLLKRAAGIEKGSAKPNREKVGRVTRQQLRQIVEVKRKDLNAYDAGARDEDDRGHRALDGPRGDRVMPKKRGKKYIEAAKKVEAALAGNGNGGLTPEAAVQMAKETSISKFDATVEAHIRLGVDPRHAEQMVRGSVVLPNGTGKKVRVARVRHRRQGQGGPGGGRRLRGRRRPGEEGLRGLDGLRRGHRDARHHVEGRSARQDPRPSRPHAQPEVGDRHVRRRRARCAR